MKLIKSHTAVRDRSLFIAGGGGGSLDFKKNPKGGITENFARIQKGDHSNFLGK